MEAFRGPLWTNQSSICGLHLLVSGFVFRLSPRPTQSDRTGYLEFRPLPTLSTLRFALVIQAELVGTIVISDKKVRPLYIYVPEYPKTRRQFTDPSAKIEVHRIRSSSTLLTDLI